jgi:hypothetical protein
MKRKDIRMWAALGLGIFIVQLLINSSANDWHNSASFGNRRFSDLMPFMAFGSAYLMSKTGKWFIYLLTILAIWNMTLFRAWGEGNVIGTQVALQWSHIQYIGGMVFRALFM